MHLDGMVLTHLFTLLHTVLEVCFAMDECNGTEGDSITVRLKVTGEFVRPFKARIFSSTLPTDHPFKTVEAVEGTFETFVQFGIVLTSHTSCDKT